MTQFNRSTHRAREALEEAGRALPGIWADYEEERLHHPPPPHLYISEQHGAGAFCEALVRKSGREGINALRRAGPLEVARLISPYTTLAAWRMTQGIYRVDPALYESLVSTDMSGDIPAAALMRLPEWCVYIETPALQVTDRGGEPHALAGAWVRLSRDDEGRDDLLILLDIPDAPLHETHTLPLSGTLEESIGRVMAEWGQHDVQVTEIAAYLRPIINIALYLCATDDISGKRGQPGNPTPTRTRRNGWRLFPADGLRTWDVGVRMGAALRAAYQAAETSGDGGEHAGPRGHVRRAHWHTFRSGPRKREDGTDIPAAARPFDLRWLPPIPVNLGDAAHLPATIRRVK